MKKLLSLLLAMLMLCSVLTLTGCGADETPDASDDTGNSDQSQTPEDSDNEPDDSQTPDQSDEAVVYTSATELYEAIWAAYGENNKFAVGGGDSEHMAEAPAQYVLSGENTESFQFLLHVNETLFAMLEDDAATLQHMMNTNTFCSAVVKLQDAAQAESFAEGYKTEIQAQQWMCGFPDKVTVILMGDYVVMAYGSEDNINNLIAACSAVDAQAAVLLDAPAVLD